MTTSESPPIGSPEHRRFVARLRRVRAERPYLRLVSDGGKLVGMAPEARPADQGEQERRAFYWRKVEEAAFNGYKIGWASHRYRETFGEWPPEKFKMP